MRALCSAALLLAGLLGARPALAQPDERPPHSEETYRQLELFSRVLSYVENSYVEEPDRKKLVYGAIQGMLDTLDPHTVFLPPDVFRELKMDTSGEFGGLGMEIARKGDKLVVVAPLDDAPAARAGLRAGDELVRIDGESTQGMDLAVAMRRLRGPAGERVTLGILREGFRTPQDIPVVREHVRVVCVEGALYEGIGHVRVKNFQDHTDQQLRKELERLRGLNGGKPLRGLVLDLRNNPGGLLDEAVAVSDRFLPGNLTIVSTRGRNGRGATVERSRDRDTEPPYPLVVLVNAGSASASEIVAGALQDHHRAVVMGSQTFGKGSVQTVIELEDGSGLKLTVARYYTPSGRSIQEKGITPDYLVPDADEAKGAVYERDLQRHFKAEPAVAARSTPVPITPAEHSVPEWAATTGMKDLALRTALDYLHGVLETAPAAPMRVGQAK
ncbi:S41 family peptidase [Simulacricoccus sp. 17bor-14]|nr:S41 family peptidase [Simulacricoccus sp. 17bor-14]